ncbi:fungal-specific transcription factor domain-containing protein [Parasitella parasitica]|nr:fungal-specific transcription factor domain-containing protein [Parasitella parasitica]
MAGPSNWQNNQTPFLPSPLYPAQQSTEQQQNFRQNDVHEPQPQTTAPSLLPLRPLQPSPYPSMGYPIYPHPKNRNSTQFEQSEQDKSDNRRTRISRACDACRRKKIKCDTNGAGNTCKNCKSSKLECTYNDSAKKRGPPKGYIEVLENRLKRMEQILGNLTDDEKSPATKAAKSMKKRKNDNASTEANNDHGDDMSQTKQVTPESSIAAAAPVAENKVTIATAGAVSEKPLAVELSSLSTEMRTRYIGDMSPLPFLAQKINFEDARIASQIGVKIRRFGQSLVLYEKADTSGKNANQKLLESLGMLKPGETIKSLNDWIYKVAGVDKATSDSLMKIYFAYIHPGLPVVNKLLFLKQYRGEIGEYPSAPLLNAIFGAAVRYIETCKLFGDKVPLDHEIETKEGWSEKLFENLLIYLKGRYSPCISTVQAMVIAQSHRASLDEKMTSGWLLNSAAIRMAQDLGLHRQSENWDIPTSEKETRKRVWWSVYIMDKWSAAATGRPQTIFDEDCDETYPNESADWEEVMDVPSKDSDDHGPRYPSLDKSVAQKAKNENIPIYQPFVQLVKLSEILGRLLQGLYTPLAKKHSEKHGSDAVVTYLDNALSEWRAALPPALQISSFNVRRLDSHGRTPLLSMSGLMYLSYCTLLILLHRPFIEKDGSQKTRSSQSSLSICTSAATRCVDIAEKMHYRDFLLVSWNFAIYPVFTASLIHIYNATNPDNIVSDIAKTNLAKACAVIKRLSKLSIGAAQLYDVLRQLTRIREISIDKSVFDDDDDDRATRDRSACLDNRCSARKAFNAKLKKDAKVLEDNNNNSFDSAGRSFDVDRGNNISQNSAKSHLNARASSTEIASPSLTIVSDPDMHNSPNSTPSSTNNGDWINGLYSSLQNDTIDQVNAQQQQIQQQQQQQQQQLDQNQRHYQQLQQQLQQQQQLSHVSNNYQESNNYQDPEPYSLRQFGLATESTSAPINNNNQAFNFQPSYQVNANINGNMLPFMPPMNPSDSFLFGLADNGFSAPVNSQPTITAYEAVPNTNTNNVTINTNNTNNTPTTNSFTTQSSPATTSNNLLDQTIFRNRPDNPFWAVPSSIELDDWTAYLLPQQSTSNVQVTSQASWNPTAQGWM